MHKPNLILGIGELLWDMLPDGGGRDQRDTSDA
jgi:hypothetical protein